MKNKLIKIIFWNLGLILTFWILIFISSNIFKGTIFEYIIKISGVLFLFFIVNSNYFSGSIGVKLNETRHLFSSKFFLSIAFFILFFIFASIYILKFSYNTSSIDYSIKSMFYDLISSFLVGTSEELIFRFVPLFVLLNNKNHFILGSIITSLFFALVHLFQVSNDEQLVYFIYVFLIGITMCYLFYLSKSFWVIVFAHSGIDFASFILTNKTTQYHEVFKHPFSVAQLLPIVYLVIIFILFKLGKKIK